MARACPTGPDGEALPLKTRAIAELFLKRIGFTGDGCRLELEFDAEGNLRRVWRHERWGAHTLQRFRSASREPVHPEVSATRGGQPRLHTIPVGWTVYSAQSLGRQGWEFAGYYVLRGLVAGAVYVRPLETAQ